MMACGDGHWWSRSQITPSSSGKSRYCGGRDAEPGRAVPGLIDHFVQSLVQLECVEQHDILTGVAACTAGITLQEGRPCPIGPRCCRAAGVPLLPGAFDVVERPQHPSHVAKGQVWLCAFTKGSQRFALEVDQDPSAAGRVEHLSEMVVAMDPLQCRPSGR